MNNNLQSSLGFPKNTGGDLNYFQSNNPQVKKIKRVTKTIDKYDAEGNYLGREIIVEEYEDVDVYVGSVQIIYRNYPYSDFKEDITKPLYTFNPYKDITLDPNTITSPPITVTIPLDTITCKGEYP